MHQSCKYYTLEYTVLFPHLAQGFVVINYLFLLIYYLNLLYE